MFLPCCRREKPKRFFGIRDSIDSAYLTVIYRIDDLGRQGHDGGANPAAD
jgi:hypothetical protein